MKKSDFVAAKWPAPDDIIGGRDLRAGGTWLAMARDRRFGIVTNFRELQRPAPDALSRGNLIPNYLRNPASAERYLEELETTAGDYSGFNLLLADHESLWYASNRADHFARPLSPGIYGLSNELLDTPWPKLQRVRGRFDPLLRQAGEVSKEELFAILADPTQAEVPVITIAMDAGFQSLGPFNRAFKAVTGVTPTEYRRLKVDAA